MLGDIENFKNDFEIKMESLFNASYILSRYSSIGLLKKSLQVECAITVALGEFLNAGLDIARQYKTGFIIFSNIWRPHVYKFEDKLYKTLVNIFKNTFE